MNTCNLNQIPLGYRVMERLGACNFYYLKKYTLNLIATS